MKFQLSREWCMKVAKLEDDAEVGVGKSGTGLTADDPIILTVLADLAEPEEGLLGHQQNDWAPMP